MTELLEKLEEAINETERVASLALRWRKDYLERGLLETWTAKRHVNNDVPPYYDYWAVEARLGSLKLAYVLRLDGLPGLTELDARFFAANGAPTILRRVARDRKLLELHTPRSHHKRAFVEEGHRKDPAVAHEPTGELCWTACPTCGGNDWDIERFDDLEPCDTLRLIAEDYEIEVQS